jgi:hypothetical protein
VRERPFAADDADTPPSVPLPTVTRPTKPPPTEAALPWPTYGADNARGRLRAEWPDGEYSAAVAGNGHLYLVGLGRIYALAPLRPGR